MKTAIILAIFQTMSTTSSADLTGIGANEMVCLTDNIYREARGESIAGQVAVAHVTYNRVKSEKYPHSFCEVVYQYKQFSWTLFSRSKINRLEWRIAAEVALHVTVGFIEDNTAGATHYYAFKKVRPIWRKKLKQTTVIGGHRFMIAAK